MSIATAPRREMTSRQLIHHLSAAAHMHLSALQSCTTLASQDYVHRVGRTGRAGARGIAITFMTAEDSKHAASLVQILRGAGQKPPRALVKMAALVGAPAPAGPAAGPAASADLYASLI